MKPRGLQHLESLFESDSLSPDTAGVSLIAAAGDVGEARLVARRLRQWLAEGIAPGAIAVMARDLPSRAALFREVFDEYDVPANLPVPITISNCGAIAMLRKAWSLPEGDFAFREVAALWRNSYFQPAFETNLALRAEGLLRQLNVPQGKDAILRALVVTAEDRLPLPLEDETMDNAKREARSQLAKRCLGFMQWFFQLWDAVPATAAPKELVACLRRIAAELGLNRTTLPGPHDAAALEAFWTTLDTRAAESPRKNVTAVAFTRVLDDIMSRTAWPLPAKENAIRAHLVEDAARLECSHLILFGLAEGSFPSLGMNGTESALAREKELFKSIITKPAREIVFSYSALDAKGQALSPSTFLAGIQARFEELPTTSQTMMLDGYFDGTAYSAAERRVQAARRGEFSEPLRAAMMMAEARFQACEATNYTGRLSDPGLLESIAEQFTPERVFSATAIENYIGCPFRFGMEKVLKLDPLEEPSEDVETTQRGTAIHRALRRYHESKPHERQATMNRELTDAWNTAVDEEVERSPGAAAQAIWRLEQRRVQRALHRYSQHWSNFRNAWGQNGVMPIPGEFEAMFGYDKPGNKQEAMTIEVEGVRVRIGGIIDRVDLAELDSGLGFWIIDYKSGSMSYSQEELRNYERLQLPLYAMAVERLFHKNARPLGLAYWLVVKEGPKRMLPLGRDNDAWVRNSTEWPDYRAQLERVVAKVVTALRSGDFRLALRREETCRHCNYQTICRINQLRERFQPLPLVD